jgi:hypothetical protein
LAAAFLLFDAGVVGGGAVLGAGFAGTSSSSELLEELEEPLAVVFCFTCDTFGFSSSDEESDSSEDPLDAAFA